MKKITSTAIQISSRLALGLSLFLALAIPTGYFWLSHERLAAILDTEAVSEAAVVTQLISSNPEFWQYQQPRLEGFLTEHGPNQSDEIRRIRDEKNNILAEQGGPLVQPLITRAHLLYDSGKIVGRVEISRSLSPILMRTFWLCLFGIAAGAAAFLLFRYFPIRALDHALQSVQESEARFRAIAATAADGIIVMDNHGKISYWNQAAEKMFGYPYQEILGNDLHLLIAPGDFHADFKKGFDAFVQSGTGPAIGNTLEFSAIRKNGTHFPIEVSVSAVELQGAWHAVGILRDISERKKTEHELLKLEKLESVGVLAGGIAHDFNNLLTVMLGSIALAQLDVASPEAVSKRLEEAEKAVIRARGLTQQLLTFSKGGAPIKKTASLPELVEESCSFYLSGSNVKCTISVGEGLRPSDVDAGQIGQVMRNLILNATQAMPNGGMIHITCDNVVVTHQDILPIPEGNYIRISVQDEGTGIAPGDLPKIFDPFFTTKPKGNGLGLALSYSIVKKHDGHMTVESDPGKGAVFHIYLPASQQDAPVAVHEDTRPIVGHGRILIMDDEDAVRRIAGEMLKILGYEPDFARDGKEALVRYEQAANSGSPFQGIIMDLTIPGGMGGKETIKKLLEIDPGAKVVVASGYSNDPVMSNYREYGFTGVIAKPYSLSNLGKILREAME